MRDFQKDFGVPSELQELIDEGFLEALSQNPAEKTVEFHMPSLRRADDQGRITVYRLTWIHPDYNAQFCHYYHETPGDLANFYVATQREDLGDERIDLNNLDDLLLWIDDIREARRL